MNFKNLKKTKYLRLLSNVCDFLKESKDFGKEIQRRGYGFKDVWKIYSLAYGFSFFVISISGHVVINGYYTKQWLEKVLNTCTLNLSHCPWLETFPSHPLFCSSSRLQTPCI
jgi:hypothetical protein